MLTKELDALTGLLSRTAAERMVNEALCAGSGGAVLLLDIDKFQEINYRHGHLAGDEALHQVGYVLAKMMINRPVARVGGDEFMVFFPELVTADAANQWAVQIRARLAQIKVQDTDTALSIRLGYSLRQEGDSFDSLLARAGKMLREERRPGRRRSADRPAPKPAPRLQTDTGLIARELREPDPAQGAFYQSYEAFQVIFRFLERSLCRPPTLHSKADISVVLFTLMGQQQELPPPECLEQQMRLLWEEIQDNLRLSDMFIQYSSCQYLVLLLGADSAAAKAVAERISRGFYAKIPPDAPEVVVHHNFPLQPTQLHRNGEATPQRKEEAHADCSAP